ncbi:MULTISPECIES: hypothetical protein [unclassified Streptomyces]|uniref:hypothetical protein n=1 Tax=unclassified Streptomyces TaxID=2593676 RepID=UPI0033E45B9F
MKVDEMVTKLRLRARQQRSSGRTVYSVAVPVEPDVMTSPSEGWVLDSVSQAIQAVEEEGWQLDRVSAYAWSVREFPSERVLLVFRR